MRVVSLVTILKSKSWKTNLQGSSRFSTKKSIASQAPTFNTKDVKMTANLPLLNAANVVFTKEPNWGFGKDSNFDQNPCNCYICFFARSKKYIKGKPKEKFYGGHRP